MKISHIEHLGIAVKSIEDISHIPYDEFVKPFEADTIWLEDLDKVEIPLMDFIFFQLKPNTTVDELLRKE